MKITREQVRNWDSKCSNGFKLDVERCVVWGDKVAEKVIDLGDGRRLKAEIGWYEVRGSAWGKVEGLRPKLNLSIWSPCTTSGMWRSQGMGAKVELTEKLYPRRNWNDLAKFTAEWDEARLLDEAKSHMGAMMDARIA